MSNEDIEKAKLHLDEERLELEKARLALENSFSKKYGTPLIGILGAIVVGLFALAQVWVASIQKAKEIEGAKIQKEREIAVAASDRDRRLRLDIIDFVFRNREVIFSIGKSAEQERIIKIIAVTFPADISSILLENLKAAVPEQQKPLVEKGQRLVGNIQLQQATQERLYYVIAMTSANRDDIESEINRIKKKVGVKYDQDFPDIEIYAPEGGLYTLLISSKSLSYTQANELKQRAMQAGFSKDTWLWQSNVAYFTSKKK